MERGIPMNYEKIIVNILDSFGVNRSYTGHGYVVYGLLLIIEDPERLEFITKSLYLDIAKHYRTNWSCVEKNIRTIANCVWDSRNTELLETIFNKSNRDKIPTNKEFLKCMNHLHTVLYAVLSDPQAIFDFFLAGAIPFLQTNQKLYICMISLTSLLPLSSFFILTSTDSCTILFVLIHNICTVFRAFHVFILAPLSVQVNTIVLFSVLFTFCTKRRVKHERNV